MERARGLSCLVCRQIPCFHFLLNGGKRVLCRWRNAPEFVFTLAKSSGCGSRAQRGIVKVSEGSLAGKEAAPDFLADATADVDREVADILVRHAKLDGNHEHVVGRQVRSFKGANFLNDSPLKQADNLAAVVEVAGEAVKFP